LTKPDKDRSVFDLIAPIYGLFYSGQKKHYSERLDALKPDLDLSRYEKVLDVGCGTGALCAVLHQRGHDVTGIDPAKKMLEVAVRKPENRGIRFMEGDVLKGLPFEEKSFDISIASYVAHGLKEEERRIMYAEMSRVSRELVIFYDYNENRSIFTDFVEWLEKGDYFNFIRQVRVELTDNFKSVQVVDATVRGAWYICTPR
jgi:ubiquinone/menaquinone biosynthesis C-methylase UbiE